MSSNRTQRDCLTADEAQRVIAELYRTHGIRPSNARASRSLTSALVEGGGSIGAYDHRTNSPHVTNIYLIVRPSGSESRLRLYRSQYPWNAAHLPLEAKEAFYRAGSNIDRGPQGIEFNFWGDNAFEFRPSTTFDTFNMMVHTGLTEISLRHLLEAQP